MMRVRKGLMAAAAVATIGVAGAATTTGVDAATDGSTDQQVSLVQKIADKFGLNKDEVQRVFDEQHAEREAKHEARIAERLQTLVDDGTISVEQKAAIETKIEELKAQREANKEISKDLSREERKAKMDAKKAELEAWAEENGLELSKLTGIFMGDHRGHRGMPMAE